MFDTENRGQVGIGTLIVFIAMVLVAAIAAGVLINTAGLLQAQAQQTGEETTDEVSNVIQFGKVVGFEGGDGDSKIEEVNATVRLASGSDPINLSEASYTIATNGNASVVSGNNNTNPGITFYQIQSLKDNATIIAEQEDLMVIQFDFTQIQGVKPLTDSQKLKFVAQAPAGGQTYTELETPQRIFTDESYIL
ncbi:MAG: archaellin/type IV pilin N-terminal domain-containing protein [Haloarculaceae archaeon]